MPAIDEFGGYSSRLRIPEVISVDGVQLDQDTTSNDTQKNKNSSKKQSKKLTELKAGDYGLDGVDSKGQAN